MNLFIKEKEIEKIVLEYLLRIRKVEEEVFLLIHEQIEQLIARVLLNINQNLKNKDASKKYECLYYLAEESRESYKAYNDLINEKSYILSDEKVRDIFKGIGGILGDITKAVEPKDDNPIAYERMVLISSGILKIKQFLFESMEEYEHKYTLGDNITKAELLDSMNEQVKTFFEKSYKRVEEIIQDTLVALDIKDEAKPYIDYMMDQKNRLETLVLVQIDVIEDRLDDEEQEGLVSELVSILQEIYQKTLTVEAKLRKTDNTTVDASDVLSLEGLQTLIENNIFTKAPKVIKVLEALENNRIDSIEELTQRIVDELNVATVAIQNDIKQKSTPYQLLSCQILEIFTEAVTALSTLKLDYKLIECEKIANGIIDTMLLKYEVLKEKDTDYAIAKKNMTITEEKKIYDIKSDLKRDSEKIFHEAVNGSYNGFITIQEKFNRRAESICQSHNKFDMAYLQRDLLFEIRTFEEVNHHSVNKLKEYDEEGMKPLTDIMAQVSRDCLKAIKRSGIKLIEPKPHDRFDGKLHEVMMASKEEGYNKGEIIDCHNVGYQTNDYVIVRANITAAR